MKASELIKHLERVIKERGDVKIIFRSRADMAKSKGATGHSYDEVVKDDSKD